MPTKITQLELTRFRGASGDRPAIIDFDPKRSVVMVFGENGTGKSTLVDAIDAVCNGELGSIRERSVQSPWKHLAAIGSDPRQLRVVLRTQGDGEYHATLSGKGVDVESRRAGAGRPSVHVLRRSGLLRLVEATPSERYEALKKFVEVGGVEKSEQALRVLAVNLRRQFEVEAARKEETEALLSDHWMQERQEGEDHPDAMAWAEARVAEDVGALRAEARDLAMVEAQIRALLLHVTGWQGAWAQAEQAAARLARSQRALTLEVTSGATRPHLVRVLREATGLLDAAARSGEVVDECPVCEQAVSPQALRVRAQERLRGLEALNLLLVDAEREEQRATEANGEVARQASGLAARLREMATLLRNRLPEAVRDASVSSDQVDAAAATIEGGRVPDQALALARRLIDCADGVIEQSDNVRARVEAHDNTTAILNRVRGNTANVVDNHQLQSRVDEALRVMEATRRAYTDRVLGEVRDEVNRLYWAIHPGEDIGLDRFEMTETRRASLEQHARFAGHDEVKPQAYFSESHLDTFGFCLWLALAKRTSGGRGVLVLDDVFTSVDASHFRRITDLLAEEASSFRQLIIATHNRQWYEFYRQSGVGVHLVKLERWSLERGLRAYEERLAVEELRDALEAERFNRQAVASQAGILLEALLDDIALIFGCRLPRSRTNEYTLGALVNGTTKVFKNGRIRRAVAEEDGAVGDPLSWEDVELSGLFEAVKRLGFIRNKVGAHFNTEGLDLSDADVETFGRASLELALAVRCPRCGQIPSQDQGTHLGCRCPKHKTELTPMTAP